MLWVSWVLNAVFTLMVFLQLGSGEREGDPGMDGSQGFEKASQYSLDWTRTQDGSPASASQVL